MLCAQSPKAVWPTRWLEVEHAGTDRCHETLRRHDRPSSHRPAGRVRHDRSDRSLRVWQIDPPAIDARAHPSGSWQVSIEGTILGEQNLESLRHRIGYVIQDGGLFPHLRACDNVTLVARHLGWTQDQIQLRLNELAQLTHFPVDGLDRYPAQLSGGQRQRVGLMRALMLDPDVLLLDEPLGALDPIVRSDLQVELRDIFRALGKTVVMVTHDMGEAGFFGDTIVLMREGRIVQTGTLSDLLSTPAEPYVERFINAQRTALHVLGEDLDT